MIEMEFKELAKHLNMKTGELYQMYGMSAASVSDMKKNNPDSYNKRVSNTILDYYEISNKELMQLCKIMQELKRTVSILEHKK